MPFYEEALGYLRDKAYAEGYQEGYQKILNEYRRPVLNVLYKCLILRFDQSAEYLHDDLLSLDFTGIKQFLDVVFDATTVEAVEQALRQIQANEQQYSH